jgi:hypothetical protein
LLVVFAGGYFGYMHYKAKRESAAALDMVRRGNNAVIIISYSPSFLVPKG